MIRFRQLLDVSSEAEQRRLAGIQNIFRKAFPYYAGGPAYVERLMKNRVTKERMTDVRIYRGGPTTASSQPAAPVAVVRYAPGTYRSSADWSRR